MDLFCALTRIYCSVYVERKPKPTFKDPFTFFLWKAVLAFFSFFNCIRISVLWELKALGLFWYKKERQKEEIHEWKTQEMKTSGNKLIYCTCVCIYTRTYRLRKAMFLCLLNLLQSLKQTFFLVRLLVREFFCLLSLLFLMATDQDFFDREEWRKTRFRTLCMNCSND